MCSLTSSGQIGKPDGEKQQQQQKTTSIVTFDYTEQTFLIFPGGERITSGKKPKQTTKKALVFYLRKKSDQIN